MRGLARSGVCLPVECVQDTISDYVDNAIDLMNSQLALLPSYGIDINTLIFNSDSRLSMKMTVIDSDGQDEADETKVGFVIVSALLGAIFIFSISTNVYILRSSIIRGAAGKEDLVDICEDGKWDR